MMRREVRVAMLIAAAFAFGPGGTAVQAADGKPEKKQKPRQVHPTGEEDGRVPTARELQAEAALEQMLSRSSEGLRQTVREDGTVSVDLEGRFMHVSLAGVRHDGTTHVSCVTTKEAFVEAKKATSAARAADAAPKAPGPALEER